MSQSLIVRLFIAGAAVMLIAGFMVLLLLASNLALSVYTYLREAPDWLRLSYAVLLGLFAAASALVIWRLLRPRKARTQAVRPPDETTLRTDLARHAAAGIDISAAQAELDRLDERRAREAVYVALYGEISSGKTSLIHALVPEARVQAAVDVRGGTTQRVEHYVWETQAHDKLIIADAPGLNEADAQTAKIAYEEALRAHIVVYVCDGDMTRDQWRELTALQQIGKPLIVVVNKQDRYSATDLMQIQTRLQARLTPDTPVVTIQSGGMEELVRVLPDGREEVVERPRAANVDALIMALQGKLADQGEGLAHLRDQAVFLLAAGRLSEALSAYRKKLAEALVDRYTRRAVIGGLAAFAPGTDIVIQTALAVALTRALCNLYEVPVRQVDLDQLLTAIQRRAGKVVPLTLAIAGNALKAFPGLGTVAGGLTHAVAYGLLFQGLGWALTDTLSTQGTLNVTTTAQRFEEKLSEDLAARARSLAALAASQSKRN